METVAFLHMHVHCPLEILQAMHSLFLDPVFFTGKTTWSLELPAMLLEYFQNEENRTHLAVVGRAAKVEASVVERVWLSFQNLTGPEEMFSYFRRDCLEKHIVHTAFSPCLQLPQRLSALLLHPALVVSAVNPLIVTGCLLLSNESL